LRVAQKGWADPEPFIQAQTDLGSSAYSHATRKRVAETRQLGNGAKAERSEVVEVGGRGGYPGGWVLASTRRETAKRDCGSGGGVL
jgi:hypothetical protein